MRLKNFEIDDEYITDVTIRRSGSIYGDRTDLTDNELLKVLKGQAQWHSTENTDHPEFAELRNLLEQQGYIKTERGWWNGDRVTKSFKLNGVIFRPGEKYPCGAAMRHHLDWKRKYHNDMFY